MNWSFKSKTLIRYTATTMITVTVNMGFPLYDSIVVRKAWKANGRMKHVQNEFVYASGELLSGKLSIDLGSGYIVHLKNGTIVALQSDKGSELNPVGDEHVLSVN